MPRLGPCAGDGSGRAPAPRDGVSSRMVCRSPHCRLGRAPPARPRPTLRLGPSQITMPPSRPCQTGCYRAAGSLAVLASGGGEACLGKPFRRRQHPPDAGRIAPLVGPFASSVVLQPNGPPRQAQALRNRRLPHTSAAVRRARPVVRESWLWKRFDIRRQLSSVDSPGSVRPRESTVASLGMSSPGCNFVPRRCGLRRTAAARHGPLAP